MKVIAARPTDAYVRAARWRTHQLFDVSGASDPMAQPLEAATHLVALGPDGPVGMAEGYAYRDLYPTLEHSPFADLKELTAVPFDQLGSVRTLWIEPAHRGGHAFVTLLMRLVECGWQRGIRHATISTLPSHASVPVYRILGGLLIGQIAYPGPLAAPLDVYLFSMLGLRLTPLFQYVTRARR